MTAFKQFDNDGDGLIDEKEFNHFVTGVLGLKLKKPDLIKLWGMLDVNRSGNVNFTEFTEMLFPNHAFAEPVEQMEFSFQAPSKQEDSQSVLKAAAADRDVFATEESMKVAHQVAEKVSSSNPSEQLAAGAVASSGLTNDLPEQLRQIIAAEIQRCMSEQTSQLAASVARLEASIADVRAHTIARHSRKHLVRTPGEGEGSNNMLRAESSSGLQTLNHPRRRVRRSPPTTEHPGRETSNTSQHLDCKVHADSTCTLPNLGA